MPAILTGVLLMLAGSVGSLLLHRSGRWASVAAAAGVLSGAYACSGPVVRVLSGGGAEALTAPWSVPFGSFAVEIDLLSCVFLVPILLLSAMASIYGHGYTADWHPLKRAAASCLFNVLAASMVVVVIARNAVLFLMAWEMMSLSSFFLVTLEHEKADVRRAGWIYLVAMHIGTAFLFALFILLGRGSGSLNFDSFKQLNAGGTSAAGLLFLLGVVGFGTKAGFIPLHVWLPEAHPAAPSHVSAVMSGVMIKTGIYGLVRLLTFLGPPAPWWGWTLVGTGLVSGILGVLFALAQHDLKRLLAYHSVENIGIIGLGLGVGVLGQAYNLPFLVIAGFGGALLHVINHALFKGLLFLGAGAVAHATGTRELDVLGGLLKRMPWTGAFFVVGAVAICGLPPLNGFVSELLIYVGAFRGVIAPAMGVALPAVSLIAGLALIGGLATACFTKAFGIVFLGEPRSGHAMHAHEVGGTLLFPMAVLAAGCLAIGLGAPQVVAVVIRVITGTVTVPAADATQAALTLSHVLNLVVMIGACGLALAGAGILVRRQLLRKRIVGEAVTWDCGYLQPSPRMQYSASSFAQPLMNLFRNVLQTRERVASPEGPFPASASLETDTPDPFMERLFRPVFEGAGAIIARLRWLQQGRLQLYVLYIVITLLGLLVWKLRQ